MDNAPTREEVLAWQETNKVVGVMLGKGPFSRLCDAYLAQMDKLAELQNQLRKERNV